MVIESIKIDSNDKEIFFSKVLKSFGIKFDYINLTEGKYFDVYDIKLSLGTRISRVESLVEDIGIQMCSVSKPNARVISSSGVYRIEIQKEEIRCSDFKTIMRSANPKYIMPICLGSDSKGESLIVDLNTIPNMLIGGTTGSGKSVLLHNIIISLISSDVSVYLADPKRVEFSMYKGCKSINWIDSSVEDFKSTLDLIYTEMEHRYEILAIRKARNIKEYNAKEDIEEKMKPIAIVIDEWADFVLQDKTLQKKLCSIAQKGRASGISIVLATQRPSVNVVSGVIKANFPGRICLRVASQIDSKVILDKSGGEFLSGSGSAMYIDGKTSTPIYFKTPYIEDVYTFLNEEGYYVSSEKDK